MSKNPPLNHDFALKVVGRSFAHFSLFSQRKNFMWENKLKRDPGPEVGGGGVWLIFNCFSKENFIRENKLKRDPGPKV